MVGSPITKNNQLYWVLCAPLWRVISNNDQPQTMSLIDHGQFLNVFVDFVSPETASWVQTTEYQQLTRDQNPAPRRDVTSNHHINKD